MRAPKINVKFIKEELYIHEHGNNNQDLQDFLLIDNYAVAYIIFRGNHKIKDIEVSFSKKDIDSYMNLFDKLILESSSYKIFKKQTNWICEL